MNYDLFNNLHVHDTKASLLDSILKVKDIVKFAKDNNQRAIALTNHGSMASFVDFVKECKKQDIKPIVGNEIYEVDDMLFKSDSKEYRQPRYHLILLARTQKGFQNLIKITSVAGTEGFYIKPRIDIDYIRKNNLGEGIVCLTGCQAGRLSRYLVDGKDSEAKKYIDSLTDVFDYVVCELQAHDTESQSEANKLIYDFAIQHDLPYTITTDAHMLSPEMMDTHSIFVEIGEGREVGEIYSGCWLQTSKMVYQSLTNQFGEDIINRGIIETSNIVNIVEDIDFGLDKGNQMPKVKIENGFNDHKEYLRHLVFSTFDEKFGHMNYEEQDIRKKRIEEELPVLFELDYTDYFIMLYMLVKEAKKRKIPLGYSRGSGANCLCLFMLNVTQVDSIRWDLDFSRFANLGRRSLADFDFDISKRRRKEMIEISEELFGKENVAPICTFNTLSTKVAIRDIGKVLNEKEGSPYKDRIPYSLRDEVAKLIPTIKTFNDLGEEVEKDLLLKDVLDKNSKLKAIYDKFPMWFRYVMDIEGLPKSMGRHAAGTLITPAPVTNYCPLCLDSEKNIMIELEMHNAMDDLGLVKMDYLGLETLDIIDDTLRLSGLSWEDVDINHLDLADKKVYDDIYKKGHTVGIFQMESAEAKRMLIEAQSDNIEDIVVVNAANRPGTKESFPTYVKNKLFPNEVKVIHEDLKEIFSKTQFILLYQEQALQLFRYAMFQEDEVDNARRSIGKKIQEEMDKLEDKFREGLLAKSWTIEQIIEMWSLMRKQADYSFNRGHAVAYALLSYLTAYLKTHYPIQFMTALLTSKSEKVEKVSVIINDCNRMGITVLPPDINVSETEFTPIIEENKILFGLLAIKGIGESMANRIIEMRTYKNLEDFIVKVQDKKTIITMIKSGALPTKNKVETLKKYAQRIFEKKEYKTVTSLPSPYKKLESFGLYVDDYRINKKVNKEKLLQDYNIIKKEIFERKYQKEFREHMGEFQRKYVQNEYMWEFDTLSMFLTNDPLRDAYKFSKLDWDLVQENDKTTLFCVIVEIKRKKDKNNNPYAYLDLYTPYGIVEATIWSRQLREYNDYIKKGNCLAIFGRKREGDHFFVEKLKPYDIWLKEKGMRV